MDTQQSKEDIVSEVWFGDFDQQLQAGPDQIRHYIVMLRYLVRHKNYLETHIPALNLLPANMAAHVKQELEQAWFARLQSASSWEEFARELAIVRPTATISTHLRDFERKFHISNDAQTEYVGVLRMTIDTCLHGAGLGSCADMIYAALKTCRSQQ